MQWPAACAWNKASFEDGGMQGEGLEALGRAGIGAAGPNSEEDRNVWGPRCITGTKDISSLYISASSFGLGQAPRNSSWAPPHHCAWMQEAKIRQDVGEAGCESGGEELISTCPASIYGQRAFPHEEEYSTRQLYLAFALSALSYCAYGAYS